MLAVWLLTVPTETKRSRAASAVALPDASTARTSSSRALHGSSRGVAVVHLVVGAVAAGVSSAGLVLAGPSESEAVMPGGVGVGGSVSLWRWGAGWVRPRIASATGAASPASGTIHHRSVSGTRSTQTNPRTSM